MSSNLQRIQDTHHTMNVVVKQQYGCSLSNCASIQSTQQQPPPHKNCGVLDVVLHPDV